MNPALLTAFFRRGLGPVVCASFLNECDNACVASKIFLFDAWAVHSGELYGYNWM